MVRIIGYTFNADYHCVDCTQRAFAPAKRGVKVDECGVPFLAHGMDKQPVHPVFDTDELPTDLEDRHGGASVMACRDCGIIIRRRDKTLEAICSE